jgi:GNAT superfamily N-acetyltransferase
MVQEWGGEVRRAASEDLPAIEAMVAELEAIQADWRVFTPRAGHVGEIASAVRDSLETEDHLVVVAEDRGRVIGMAHAEVRPPSGLSDQVAVDLSRVVVLPGHRGGGAGRAMVAEIARYARARGVAWIALRTFHQNAQGMAFWRSLGFSPRLVQLVGSVDEVAERSAADPPGV